MKTPRIFISYGSQDRETAVVLAEELRRKGFIVWLDVDEVTAGASIVSAISAGLAETDLVLVLLSRASVSSPWCRAEYEAVLTREIETGTCRVVPVILDDVLVPPLLASKHRIDLQKGKDSPALRWIEHTLWEVIKELPITTRVPVKPKYRYSRLAMIISGVLDELPVPALRSDPLLEGRTLVDLYRAVDRLIERFEEVCRQLAFVLSEASAGPMSYPSERNLRSTGIIEVNTKLLRIATDMRDIAAGLREVANQDSVVAAKLQSVAQLCAAISLNEDVLVVTLSKPQTLPTYLLEARGKRGAFYDMLEPLFSEAVAFDSTKSNWGEPNAGEISDLERIVLDMERYRSALRAAIAEAMGP